MNPYGWDFRFDKPFDDKNEPPAQVTTKQWRFLDGNMYPEIRTILHGKLTRAMYPGEGNVQQELGGYGSKAPLGIRLSR